AQLSRARQEAEVYKANIRKQNDEIKRLTAAAQEKQSQIDEAKRLEEEARKAQELALQRQAEEEARQNSGGGDSESSSDSSSGSSSKTYASASNYSGSGSKGQQIANYACQFIGNPYVPGGTSLTEGADCSGFVWRVYKDFGYSLPRTSYSMRSSGTGVSYSEAQPGDVVCYAGHVGIYIGGGQIVHASTQKTGIKITHATYKEILSVRRIV
ncbi:MAG: C40 family peptidase, partial [Lachnospiraceae bacterium]|nr:C40 family peptidase [Lachnospiraceae bacterium]